MKICTNLLLALLVSSATQFYSNAQTWVSQNPGVNVTFNDVFFVSETTGWVVGTQGQILHTTDGGETWTNQFANVIVASSLNGVCFTSETNGWIVGNDGVLLQTTNAGANWNLVDANFGTTNLNGIDFFDDMRGMLVGESSYIRLTTDGGATWTYNLHWNAGMYLTKADMANATQITCLFSGSPYWANVGSAWNSVTLSNLGYTQPYNDLWFNNGVGYVVGLNGIAKTTNYSTYVNQLAQPNVGLNGVHFTSNNVGWAVGDQGKTYFTTDGGTTWDFTSPITTSSLKAVHFFNATHGWAVGESGTIIKYTTCAPTQSSIQATGCYNSYFLNDIEYTATGIYYQTLQNAGGCDSTIMLDLTMTFGPSAFAGVFNGNLMASLSEIDYGAPLFYQWIDCNNNNQIIPNATSQMYNPSFSGTFAVILSDANCSDTSNCVAYTPAVGITETLEVMFSIFPNPSTSMVYLSSLELGSTITIFDVSGKIVYTASANNSIAEINVSGFVSGMYFVQVQQNGVLIGTKKLQVQ